MTSDQHPLSWLNQRAEERRATGLRRSVTPRAVDAQVLDLASNDYLGLTRDPRVIEAAAQAVRAWGGGSTGSRLVTGTTDLHAELESALADFAGVEAALVFSSGYLANLGAITALTDSDTLVASDAVNHASIVDACRLSKAQVTIYRHRDTDDLRSRLSSSTTGRRVVVTDAVFSVDGEATDLDAVLAVAQSHDAAVIVDEAHSFGVAGDGGRGLTATTGHHTDPGVVQTLTLSKAFGSQGGAVLGSRDVIDHLIDAARPFIFDTGLAPANVAAALAALRIIEAEPERPERARANARHLVSLARDMGLRASDPDAAVASIRVGSPVDAVRAAEICLDHGVQVGCFRPPSVPDSDSRLRLTARADLSEPDLACAAAALAAVARDLPGCTQ